MLILTIENLAHSYGERTLFKNVSFNIETGDKIGLIGINGTGKSTLLRHIAQFDGGKDPETGVPGKVVPNGSCVIEYLEQNPDFDPEASVIEQIFKGNSPMMTLLRNYEKLLEDTALHPDDKGTQRKLMEIQQQMDQHFAWQLESEAKATLTRLGITDFNQKMKTLSGGQRKRVALAGVLVRPSDLLILDEPTNHMDNETVAWLEEQLQKRKGALLMVTHDRYFFDRVINRTLELDNGTAYLYTANYSGFLQKRAERRELENAAARKLQNIYRRELAWISRGAEARRTKKKDRVERFAEIEAAAKEKVNHQELEISSAVTRLGKTVVELDHVSCFYEGVEYIHDFSYILLRDDRVGIIGANGVGKTTLMDIIAGRLQPDTGRVTIGQTVKIGYFSQHSEFPDEDERVLEYIKDAGNYVLAADGTYISSAMMLERFLFPPELQWVPIRKLSGGEQRRLYLLHVLMEAPNVLLLDEPTNDLDIPTLSVLEEYLDTFAGAVIAVSHDRYFLDRFAKRIFAVEEGGMLRQYPGGYSDYEKTKRLEALERDETENTLQGKVKNQNTRNKKEKQKIFTEERASNELSAEEKNSEGSSDKLTFSEKIELEKLEEKIAGKEAESKMIGQEISLAGNEFVKIAKLSEELTRVEKELETLTERWLELSERDE
ncbi:MAG: ABC-F family ATP-binding cassette domain-containing protein [Succiniclasticum sp.]|uniref:ABC-F family ATP-binding cassette domain-containing protein n=1 Tax=Succiniclasticum sp. TaxID=2775030 RepID=UPI002A91533B|nr:ABC-F family ATP-binding cassette domain-containing protein [Succiniclasticum sp.]MDY6291012.1 ABC-F family ATP-binding cassette domain-containing protein [Succiniclasticum sp.]